jgi:thioesterase domain-containing protein
MARRLEEENEEVELLALFDSFIVSRYEDQGTSLDPQTVANGIQYYLAQMQLESPVPINELAQHEPLEQIHLVLDGLKAQGIELPEETPRQAENLLTLWEINGRAAQRYVPRRYRGPFTLFVADDNSDINPEAVAEQVASWQQVSDLDPNVVHLTGSHQTILLDDSKVAELAAHMQGLLDHNDHKHSED